MVVEEEQSETPTSKEGDSKIIPLGADDQTIVNSQYENVKLKQLFIRYKNGK